MENLFRIPTMALLNAIADGSPASYDVSGYEVGPFAGPGDCGPGF